LGTRETSPDVFTGPKTPPNRSSVGDESIATFSNPSPIRKEARCANDTSTDDPTAANALFKSMATGIYCFVGQQVHAGVVLVWKPSLLIRCEFAEPDRVERTKS
jgi:hypothetical protein